MEAIYAEHAAWVDSEYPDEDIDSELYEYWIKSPRWAIGDQNLYMTFEDTRQCVLENFPEVVEDGVYRATLFNDIKWLVFEEGWFLNEVTHSGIQIAGVVWAGHIIGLDDEFLEDGETIVHEMVHVFVPAYGHNDDYVEILRHCKPIVWPEPEVRFPMGTRGPYDIMRKPPWWETSGGDSGRYPFDVRNP